MIPPTGGREQEPAAQKADASFAYRDQEKAPPEPSGPPGALWRLSQESPRVQILVFGIFVGALITIVFSLVQSIFVLATTSASASPFTDSAAPGRTFFTVFVGLVFPTAPWFMLIATLAAAADVLLRRGERDARATRGVLKTLAQRTRPRDVPAERSAQQIVNPLTRDLNLELDSPEQRG